MPSLKRIKTEYPGVFYIEGTSPVTGKPEKIFYIRYRRKDGKLIEEKAGRQFQDDMTAWDASTERALRIRKHNLSNNEKRETEELKKRKEENRWTVSKIWEEYKLRKQTSKSLNIDKGRFEKHIFPIIGNKELCSVSRVDIQRMKDSLLSSKKKLAPQTVKHVLALVKRISNFAVNNDLSDGISFKIELPHVDNKKTEFLTTEELKRLIEVLENEPDIQIRNIFKLAMYSGMRRGEIFNLEWRDINLERGFLTIKNPKGGVSQQIPLNAQMDEILSKHPRTKSSYVFPDKEGKKRYQITREAERIKTLAGLPADFRPLHGLRHHFASTLADSGLVDMYTLQKLLTHKSPIMTQRYSHLHDSTLKRASNIAGDLINTASTEPEKKVINFDDHKK